MTSPFPGQDGRHYGPAWNHADSPHRDVNSIAMEQQLSHYQSKLQEMVTTSQHERVRANEMQNARCLTEVRLRDLEKDLAIQQQKAGSLSESLRVTTDRLTRRDTEANEHWGTVEELIDLLRRQFVNGEEVDIPLLYREKEDLSYERNELRQALAKEQGKVDRLKRGLDEVKLECETAKNQLEATLELRNREFDQLSMDYSKKSKHLDSCDERCRALIASKDLEIGQLQARLGLQNQTKVGPVPQTKSANHNNK